MPAAHRLRWLAVCAVPLFGWTCSFPEDESPKVLVLIQAPRTFLLRGERLKVQARAVRVVGTDTVAVPNAVVTWSSANPNFATVQRDTGNSATVTGVNSGTAGILARAANFDKARQGDLSIRVANPLEIDSARPRIVRYGEVLRVYGIGVDSLFLSSLGGVNLIPYPFSATRNKVTGEGRVSYWVPPPATSDSLFYLGAGVFGFADSVTKIVPKDIFDPNDTIPARINLDAGGPWPQLPSILFLNPALAFEEKPRGVSGADWFDFTTSDSVSDYTVFINFPSSSDTTGVRTFILDSLRYSGLIPGGYAGRDSADFIGSNFMRCKGQAFQPALAPRESTVVALRGLPSHSLHVLASFSPARPERYGLAVIKGYSVADPRIKPDKYEPNNFCHYADFGVRRIPLPSAGSVFSDTLTIDNPHAIDWLRIDLPAPLAAPVLVEFHTLARPFALPDTSDIDIYVFTVPNSATSTGLTRVGVDTSPSSTGNLTLTLNSGPGPNIPSYYVAIVDFAGVPTRYSLCIARATTCTPIFPAPPPAALTAPSSVVRARRHRAGATWPFLLAAPPAAGTGTRGLFDPRQLTFP